jgi:hypothetical protein
LEYSPPAVKISSAGRKDLDIFRVGESLDGPGWVKIIRRGMINPDLIGIVALINGKIKDEIRNRGGVVHFSFLD